MFPSSHNSRLNLSRVDNATGASSVRGALAGLSLAMLLSSLGTSIANVGLPTFTQVFEASFQDVQWIVLAYLLAVTTLIVSAGRLGDLFGRRLLLLTGIALFVAASLACSLAPWLWLLVVARAIQGFGAAIMMALTMAFVAGTVSKERIGSAMGLLGTMSAVGTALGPSLGGLLIAGFGWQALFMINLPLGLLALLLAWRYLPSDPERSPEQRVGFDVPGMILLALTLASYALAMTVGRGHFGWFNVALLLAGIVGLGFFVRVEAKAASPLIRLALFRDPVLSTGFASSFLVTTVVMATLVVGPFYLSGGLNLTAPQVGLVMSAGPVIAALTGIPAGRLVDRFGAGAVIVLGLVAMVAGSLTMAAAALGIPGYVGPLVVLTAGYALFQAANNTAVMKEVSPDQRGVVSGLLNLSRNLGLVTGASAMGAVFTIAAGTSDMLGANSQQITNGFQVTFAVASVLLVIALVLMGMSATSRRARR